jgi:hypothetical protein
MSEVIANLTDAELAEMQTNLTIERDQVQAKLLAVTEEIEKRDNKKKAVIEGELRNKALETARLMLSLGMEVPSAVLELLAAEDAKAFGAPKTFADIAASNVDADEHEVPRTSTQRRKSPAPQKKEKITSIDGIVTFLMFHYFALTNVPTMTSFLNSKATHAGEKYASSIDDIRVFMPYEVLKALKFDATIDNMDDLASDFAQHVADLTHKGSKSISTALAYVTDISFILSLMNLTITRLVQNPETRVMMEDFVNGQNPFINLSKRIKPFEKSTFSDEEYPQKPTKKGNRRNNRKNN